ncbi:carbohydrate ABC transporter permease [Cohnella fermenti]|nr:sugar ABC transporter permease [Cohnella fermenti]
MLKSKRFREVSYAFAIPALLFYCVFFIYPSLQSFYFSMTDWNGMDPHYRFTGLDNFLGLWNDGRFGAAFRNTIRYAVGLTIGQIVFGLLLAVLVNRGRRADNWFRTVFFSPQVISMIAIGYIWSYILDPINGSLNYLLDWLGLSSLQQDWLGSFKLAIWSVTGVSVWQGAGWCMVIFLANLQSVPQEYIEAASMDGATGLQRFRHVILPLLAPAFTITIVTGMIAGLKMFDLVMVMTKGGPGFATESISSIIYNTAFLDNRFGEATAMGIVMFLIILVITAIQLWALNRRGVEA